MTLSVERIAARSQRERAVIVAVTFVRVMQASVDKIVNMLAMRNRLVSAARSMRVAGAANFRGATQGIRFTDRYDMLINVIVMHMVQVAVMEIVDVTVVPNRRVPTARAVSMVVIRVLLCGTVRHCCSSLVVCDLSYFRSAA